MCGIQENFDFKAAEPQQKDGSARGTKFVSLRVRKGLSSIRKASGYKQSCHQKGFRKQPMLENDKTGVEKEKYTLHCVQDG